MTACMGSSLCVVVVRWLGAGRGVGPSPKVLGAPMISALPEDGNLEADEGDKTTALQMNSRAAPGQVERDGLESAAALLSIGLSVDLRYLATRLP